MEDAGEGWLAANVGGSRNPVVFLQTWPEEQDFFSNLEMELAVDQQVYALVSPAREVCAHLETVDDWVEHTLPRLRALPLELPYDLAGWSFGGVIALEVARRLRDSGTPVRAVHMIDAWLPRPRPRGARGRMARRVQHLRRATGAARVEYMQRVARRLAVRAHLRNPPEVKAAKPVSPRARSIWVPYLKYRASPLEVPAILYSVAESVARHEGDPTLGFGPFLAAGFEQEALPGDHWSMWQAPEVGALAAALARHVP